jgi:ribosomal protein S27AE
LKGETEMTREEKIAELINIRDNFNYSLAPREVFDDAIKALEQEPRKGEWLRMSDLSEQEDDRYKCSRCGNVIHHKDEMNLYTFNSWCGRCGSDNGRHIMVDI